jgi:hypothetical protein
MNLTVCKVPPRSRLYHLEPEGLGTPYIECLSSYFTRIARAHSVSIRKLFAWELLPLLQVTPSDNSQRERKYGSINLTAAFSTVNGSSEQTRTWVRGLETLTKRKSLRFLTALPLGNSVSSEQLIKKTLSWCPRCFQEWRQIGREIYYPLLWTFIPIDVCPLHNQQLAQVCNHCRREQPRVLRNHAPVGYCLWCRNWLGQGSDVRAIKRNVSPQQLWFATAMSEWISAAQNIDLIPTRQKLARTIATLINITTGGNAEAFSHLVGSYWPRAVYWRAGATSMRLSNLLKICFVFDINLSEILINEEINTDLTIRRKLPIGSKVRGLSTESSR